MSKRTYVRESNRWPARRIRKWARGRDLDKIRDFWQMAIATVLVVLVFLAIALAETLTFVPAK